MHTKPIAIFDLDGTLLDTLRDLTDSVNRTLSAYGYPARSDSEVRRFLGNGYRYLLSQALPDGIPEADKATVLAFFKDYYASHCLDHTGPYAGIPEMMARLQKEGWLMAIVSNKGHQAASDLCAHFFPGILTLGESERLPRKPRPEMVFEAIRLLGGNKERAVYIGDSEVDLATARNASVPCISCTWGFRDSATLLSAGATHLVHTPEELADAISSLSFQSGE